MADLTNPRAIYAKGFLFFVGALLSCALLVWEHPTPKVVLLLAVALWCACRGYYFAFYVIEHYLDPGYRFAGLGSFARYLWKRRRAPAPEKHPEHGPPR